MNTVSTAHAVESLTRAPLEELLHALNQPLTGLQCAMEVALAAPRTVEYYAAQLRTGLELTERMRALVNAIREVTDAGPETDENTQLVELNPILLEVLHDLGPVAAAKGVHISLARSLSAFVFEVRLSRQKLFQLFFRWLESALSLAQAESVIEVEMADGTICIRWSARPGAIAEFSRAEMGLLVAQAGWERAGLKWQRAREQNREMVTLGSFQI